jgi:hypothetical protein
MSVKTLWRGRPPPKRKETALRVGAPATLSSFASIDSWKRDDGEKPGLTGTLSGRRSGRAGLRREQRERLESKPRERPSHGKDDETDHRRYKHSALKEMAVHL